jgi:hypothetical protein
MFPDYFDAYKAVIPEDERGDMIAAYYKRLTGDDEVEKLKWYVYTPPKSFEPTRQSVNHTDLYVEK